jgi:hypothetical protein
MADLWSPYSLAVIGATFLVAGLVKGVIGLGLPTVALAVLTATLGLKPAIALLLIPAFATNVWQSVVGGALAEILRRLSTLLIGVCAGTWVGVRVLAGSDARLLASLLGVLLGAYAIASLLKVQVRHQARSEPWLSPVIGTVNGVLTGMTGAYAVPALLYLQAMDFPRDRFVQAMGVLFLVSTIALAAALGDQDLLSPELGMLSLGAVLPSLLGMVAGARLRHRLSEAAFRKTFFVSLLILGAFIAVRPFV